MSKIKSFFGGAPKVDTSAIQRQEQLVRDQEAKLAKEEEERKKKDQAKQNARTGRNSNNSLLTGLETGVTPVSDGRRTQLG